MELLGKLLRGFTWNSHVKECFMHDWLKVQGLTVICQIPRWCRLSTWKGRKGLRRFASWTSLWYLRSLSIACSEFPTGSTRWRWKIPLMMTLPSGAILNPELMFGGTFVSKVCSKDMQMEGVSIINNELTAICKNYQELPKCHAPLPRWFEYIRMSDTGDKQ